jgi:hypothetical protein
MYGGNGNDTFWGQDLDSSAYSFAKDFGGQVNGQGQYDGDRISLQKEKTNNTGNIIQGSQYWIQDNGSKKDIRRRTCNSQTACQGTPSWGSDHTNVAVEGGRVSALGVNAQFLKEKIDNAMANGSSGNEWFVAR